MPTLHRLHPAHATALLAFEQANRAYFARSVPDRGDAYFAEFAAGLEARLAEQEAGVCHFHLLVEDGEVLGRVNLVDVTGGAAELGFRIAEHATGRGLATSSVNEVCALAGDAYGLRRVWARATVDNAGSRAVLTRAGFVVTGELELTGKPALRFERQLGAAHA